MKRKSSLIGSCPECNNGLLSCSRYSGSGATRKIYCPTCGWQSEIIKIDSNSSSIEFDSMINNTTSKNNI